MAAILKFFFVMDFALIEYNMLSLAAHIHNMCLFSHLLLTHEVFMVDLYIGNALGQLNVCDILSEIGGHVEFLMRFAILGDTQVSVSAKIHLDMKTNFFSLMVRLLLC